MLSFLDFVILLLDFGKRVELGGREERGWIGGR